MQIPTVRFAASSSYEDALARACDAWGVETEYWDIWGRRHAATPELLSALLGSLGVDASGRDSLDQALEDRLWREWSCLTDAVVVASAAAGPFELLVRAPESMVEAACELEVRWEGGGVERRRFPLTDRPAAAQAALRERVFLARRLPLPAHPPLGYHDVRVTLSPGGPELSALTRWIVCPDRAWLPETLEAGARTAGLAVSLYGVRSARNWGCGDFTDLERLSEWCARVVGVSFIGLNPLHAIANRQPYNTSPYLPDCAFYRNFIYLDLERVEDLRACPAAVRLLARPEVQAEIERLRQSALVEYERVHRLKLFFLKLAFRGFLREHHRRDTPRAREFHAYVEREGDLLERYAIHSALDQAFHRRYPDIWNWPDWPLPYRDPDSAAVRDFAQRRATSVLFYKYAQWQVDVQLAALQEHARASGLSIGLYHDLALATDARGADLWAHRRFYVSGCRVGSPPDGFAPQGQDWGFPPPHAGRHSEDCYRLFADSIRRNARHGGALRIDHVMRFFRLYWIPDGMPATHGTYVRDHAENLLRILALESVRQRVILVGEDLGTVPDSVREALDRFGILSYRLLYFEKEAGGQFKLPHDYPRRALVAATTHDLPTLAGFWAGRDVEARRAAGLLGSDSAWRAQSAERAAEKQKLLDALFRLGLLPEWFPRSAAQVGELTGELHNAITGYLASTPSMLMVLNQEDLTKETEQQNLPGSTHQYPNWRRKMKYSVEEMETSPAIADYVAMFRHWLEKTGRGVLR